MDTPLSIHMSRRESYQLFWRSYWAVSYVSWNMELRELLSDISLLTCADFFVQTARKRAKKDMKNAPTEFERTVQNGRQVRSFSLSKLAVEFCIDSFRFTHCFFLWYTRYIISLRWKCRPTLCTASPVLSLGIFLVFQLPPRQPLTADTCWRKPKNLLRKPILLQMVTNTTPKLFMETLIPSWSSSEQAISQSHSD